MPGGLPVHMIVAKGIQRQRYFYTWGNSGVKIRAAKLGCMVHGYNMDSKRYMGTVKGTW